ncbi:molybdopterin-dependent oxidoreductase [Vreelandella aquamarina]|uniref:molybdopterin-dependent oxidoreductase n=1 Tax=Vreelandella aquamarina TaxID=77097 RepID=UPI001190E972|nr:molybdopterin-dependent oxidoreductase [Halomonas sp.]TVM05405.1 MAG: molybdopterin-dependent oxidoreductase [Halomonas sp.]
MHLRVLLPSLSIGILFAPLLWADDHSAEGHLPAAAERPLSAPSGPVLLTITGAIQHANAKDSAQFDEQMLATLETHTLATTTSVTDGVNQFEGFLMRDLLDWVGAQGDQVIATALNDYIVEIPLEDFYQYDVLAATHMDGEALTPRDKGPLWIVYPRDDHRELQDIRYDYRWVWQLNGLEVE